MYPEKIEMEYTLRQAQDGMKRYALELRQENSKEILYCSFSVLQCCGNGKDTRGQAGIWNLAGSVWEYEYMGI
jgi:hypothetical protein